MFMNYSSDCGNSFSVMWRGWRESRCGIFTWLVIIFLLSLSLCLFFQFHLLSNLLSFQDFPSDSGSSSHVSWCQGTCPSLSPGRRMAGRSQRAWGWPLTTLTSQAHCASPTCPWCTMGTTPALPGTRRQLWSIRASWSWEVSGAQYAWHLCSKVMMLAWHIMKITRMHRICCHPIQDTYMHIHAHVAVETNCEFP